MVISGTNLFHNCTFVLEFDALTRFKAKQCWRRKITENGGTVSYVFTRKTNYVVLFGDMLEKSSYKQRQAVQHNIPVVRCEFITDSLEQQQILPTGKYEVGEPISGKNFRKGRISKLQKAKTYLNVRHHKTMHLNAIKAWSLDDPEAPSPNDDKYEVAKWALLKSMKMVHVIEVHALTSSAKFRLYHQGGQLDGEHIKATEGPTVWYLDTADEVLICFEQLHKRYTSGLINMEPWHMPKLISNQIGSHKLKMILDDICSMYSDLDPDVGQFVEMIWKEAIQEAEKMLTISMQHTKIDKVDGAMAILKQIRQIMKKNESDSRLTELVEEFYREALPHKQQYITPNMTPKMISEKLDLCQLIYDVLAVSEATDFSPAASTVAKYRALRCHVTKLNQSNFKFQDIRNICSNGEQSITVHHIFEVGRTVEDILYQEMSDSIGNSQLLMHASGPQNLLGILSRGLLLPQAVVEEHGITRTDGGKLGYGIYFSNSFETCLHYAEPSHVTGMRMLIVCDVALGNCCDCTSVKPDLTAPPTGYHSCHGVKMTEENTTDFMDDEFVIYNTSQQRVRYVVLFTLPNDPPICSIQTTPEEEENMAATSSSIDITDLKDLPDPLSKVTGGLIGSKKSVQIPLRGVHIRAKILDLVAKVVVLQAYKNNMTEPIEAKYVFPLDETAAVCGFEAFINGKHIIGEIKEKKTALREYREAISKGHGAYLMDEEEPDVFTVSVGNLPPKSEVLIKVTYITELKVEGDSIALTIPATVAPWVKDSALAQQTQSESTVLQVSDPMDCQISMQAAIEMPFEISSLKSSTHRLKYKKTATKAVVEIPKKCEFVAGFQLLITLAEIHVPRMWVECHPERDLQACMLAFYPEFEAAIDPSPEVIFLVDLSNSMKGDPFRDARKVLLLALDNLPEKATFNIVLFGSSFKELFQFPHKITKNSTDEAIKYIEAANPVMGCSDVLSPLKSHFLLSPAEGSRSIFLISDGFVGNKVSLFQTVATNSAKNRLFCLGVGSNRDSHTLCSLANHGGGTYEYYNSKTKSKWKSKIASQIEQATRPGISHVQVEWGTSTNKQDPPLQAPCQIPSLFSGSRQVVYGFVKNCTQAKLMANVDGQEFETIVSTSELNFTEGKMLHQLAARAVIRDYEDGVLSNCKVDHKVIKQERKQHIIELSKEFDIVTPYTSFIAVEERSKGEVTRGPSIQELLDRESVDILTYMGWMNPDIMDDKDPLQCVEELLRKARIAETFSQMEAERCYLSVLDYRADLMQEENRELAEKVLETIDQFFSNQDSENARKIQHQFHKSLPVCKPLTVKTLTGRSIQVTAGTMAELKSEIMSKEGLPEDCIRLIYNGKQLQNSDYLGMPANSNIFLVLRLRGGPQFISSAPDSENSEIQRYLEAAAERYWTEENEEQIKTKLDEDIQRRKFIPHHSIPQMSVQSQMSIQSHRRRGKGITLAANGMELESYKYPGTSMDLEDEDGVTSKAISSSEEDEDEDSDNESEVTSEEERATATEVSEKSEEKNDRGKKLGGKGATKSIKVQDVETEDDSDVMSEEEKDTTKKPASTIVSEKSEEKKEKGKKLGFKTKPLMTKGRGKGFNVQEVESEEDSDVTSEDERDATKKPASIEVNKKSEEKSNRGKKLGGKGATKSIKVQDVETEEDSDVTSEDERDTTKKPARIEVREDSAKNKDREKRLGFKTKPLMYSKGKDIKFQDVETEKDVEKATLTAIDYDSAPMQMEMEPLPLMVNMAMASADVNKPKIAKRRQKKKAEDLVCQTESTTANQYLMNLNESTAYYDPKSRTMRGEICHDENEVDEIQEFMMIDSPEESLGFLDNLEDTIIQDENSAFIDASTVFNPNSQTLEPIEQLSKGWLSMYEEPENYRQDTFAAGYSATSPAYSPTSPAYSPAAPAYSPTSPAYSPAAPAYTPTAPAGPTFTQNIPTSAAYIPMSAAYNPTLAANYPKSAVYNPASAAYSPTAPPHYQTSVAHVLTTELHCRRSAADSQSLQTVSLFSRKSRGKTLLAPFVNESEDKNDDIAADDDSSINRAAVDGPENSDRGSSLERRHKSWSGDKNSERYCDRSRNRSSKKYQSSNGRLKTYQDRSRSSTLERSQPRSRSRGRSSKKSHKRGRNRSSERSYSRSRERNLDRYQDRSRGRRSEKSFSSKNRRSERSYSRSTDRNLERYQDRSRGRRSERSYSGSRDRNLERYQERSRDRRSERSYSRSRDRSLERPYSRSRHRKSERSYSRSRERNLERYQERSRGRKSDRSYSRSRDRRCERSYSRSRDRSLERYEARRIGRRSERSYSSSRDRSLERYEERRRGRRSESSCSIRERRSVRSYSSSSSRDRSLERYQDRSRGRRSERSYSSRNRRSVRSYSRSTDRNLERYQDRSRGRRSERFNRRSKDRSLEDRSRGKSLERYQDRSRGRRAERSYSRSRDRRLDRYNSSRDSSSERSHIRSKDSGSERFHSTSSFRGDGGLDVDKRHGHMETDITEKSLETFEIQLAEEELQQSLCSYPSQFEGYVHSKQREEYFRRGSLFCLQETGSIKNQTCFSVELWAHPKNKERLNNVEWPETLYMNFVPEYLLNMSCLQPLLEDSVTASIYPSKARPSLSKLDVALTSGLVGYIQAKQKTGELALLLVMKTYPCRPISLLIPADCEAMAANLQSLIRQHKAKVADHCIKQKEMEASDEPYIDMWKSLKKSPLDMDLDKLPPLNELGLWSLGVMEAVGVNQLKLEQLLKSQGLLSLSRSVQDEGILVFCTFLVGIFWFMHEYKQQRLPKWLCKCENIIEICLDVSSVLVHLQCMEEPISVQFDFPPEAYIQLQSIKSKWTPYIRQLELGKNLTHLVDCLLQAIYEYS